DLHGAPPGAHRLLIVQQGCAAPGPSVRDAVQPRSEALPPSRARRPCPRAVLGSPARAPCSEAPPQALLGSRVREPCSEILSASSSRKACPEALIRKSCP